MLFGLVFAACARQQFMNGADPWGRELVAVLSFEAILAWPIALYFYLVFPDWSLMYLTRPEKLPWGFALLVVLGNALTLVGGYLAGWALLRARKPKVVHGAIGGVALALLLFAVLTRGRLGASGTYEQFHAGDAVGIGQGKLLFSLIATTVATGAAIALVGRTLWEQGKRTR